MPLLFVLCGLAGAIPHEGPKTKNGRNLLAGEQYIARMVNSWIRHTIWRKIMGSDKKRSVETVFRDIYDQTKPEVEKFFKSVESMFDISFKSSDKEAETADGGQPNAQPQTAQQTAGGEFNGAHYRWNPVETYVIDASDRLVVTGTVVFDDKLSFTKSYNFTTGELKVQDNRPLSAIHSARPATSEERELLLPKPNLEEALAILRGCISSPQERKAFDVIKSALGAGSAAVNDAPHSEN